MLRVAGVRGLRGGVRARRLCSEARPIRPGETKARERLVAQKVADASPFGFYCRALLEKPLLTNALTAGALGAVGDAAAQYAEYFFDIMSPGKNRYNWQRTVNMAAFGLIAGPIYSAWYRGLDRAAKSSTFGLGYEALIVSKVLADNLLFSPLMLHLYYGVTGLMEGRPLGDIVENARGSFYRAWGLGISLWFPVQFFNFHLMAVHLQPIVVAGIDTAWKATLSCLNHKAAYGKKDEAAGGEAVALGDKSKTTSIGPYTMPRPPQSFVHETPTQKLHACQRELVQRQAMIMMLQEKVAEQEKEIARLR